jgi:type I restriction enzyme M protein
MEACLLITKANKQKNRKGKILFINAVHEVKQVKTIGFLEDKNIDKIFKAYHNFKDIDNFTAVTSLEDVLNNNGNMSISLYVRPDNTEANYALSFEDAYYNWNTSGKELKNSMNKLFQTLGK